MGSYTTNMSLFMRDPATEGSERFSVKSQINNNLEAIDTYCGANRARIETLESAKNTHASQIAAAEVMQYGSYVGDGAASKTISMSSKMYIRELIIYSATNPQANHYYYPLTSGPVYDTYGSDGKRQDVSWTNSGKSVTLTTAAGVSGNTINISGQTYYYIARGAKL